MAKAVSVTPVGIGSFQKQPSMGTLGVKTPSHINVYANQ